MRISEIAGMNLSDVRADHLRVLGKGNKERVVYLNDATAEAINQYLLIRKGMAFFRQLQSHAVPVFVRFLQNAFFLEDRNCP